MANGGSLNNQILISPQSWEKLHSNKTSEWQDEKFLKSTFTAGGLCNFEKQDDGGKSELFKILDE